MPNGTEDQVGFLEPQSKHTYIISLPSVNITHKQGKGTLYLSQPEIPTLLARFDLSFSKIFWPSVLDAKLMMIAEVGTRV